MKKKKKSCKVLYVLMIIILCVLFAILIKISFFWAPVELVLIPFVPDISTIGYTEVIPEAYITNGVGVVVLSSECYRLEGVTDAWIAEAIIQGIENKTSFRPDIHDVVRDILKTMEIKVIMVKVVDIVNSTFIGRLVVKEGSRIASLDIRPSNAVAIAVRVGAPIYVENSLLENYGKKVC